MLWKHVALVSEVALIDMDGLTRVSAALQRQVAQDLAPIWQVCATVDPFSSLERVPAGYWTIVVTAAGLPRGVLGQHRDENGQPKAWVEWSESWSITASHECLEMLVDPWGSQLRTGAALDDPQRQVEYLLEVCDPCQDAAHAYTINDTLVSDFYTPEFFDRNPRAGKAYSLTGAIERPRQVLHGGYLSWRDLQTNHWHQIDGEGRQRDLGLIQLGGASLRECIDARTPEHLAGTRLSREEVQGRVGLQHARAKEAAFLRASRLRASLQQQGEEA